MGLVGGSALGLGLAFAPFTGGLSLAVSLVIVGIGAVAGGCVGIGISNLLAKSHIFGNTKHTSSTRIVTTVGFAAGALAGATKGALFGALLSPVTFGLSIPVGALVGACVFGCAGGSLLGLFERVTGVFGGLWTCYKRDFMEESMMESSSTDSYVLGNADGDLSHDSDSLKYKDPDAYVNKVSKQKAEERGSTNASLVGVGGSAHHSDPQGVSENPGVRSSIERPQSSRLSQNVTLKRAM